MMTSYSKIRLQVSVLRTNGPLVLYYDSMYKSQRSFITVNDYPILHSLFLGSCRKEYTHVFSSAIAYEPNNSVVLRLSTIFQSCQDGATASWVLTSTLGS